MSPCPLDLAALATAAGSSADTSEGLSRHLVELIALILLPLGMFMCLYALYTFVWRASNIAKKKVRGGLHNSLALCASTSHSLRCPVTQATQFDDRYGPLLLCGAVVAALTAIFLISCIDFMEVSEWLIA